MDVTMPQLGETVTEGTITRWFKQVGDQVAADEPLFEVSTDKVDSEVPAPAAGVLSEILVAEGDTVEVGVRLAVISDGAGGAAPAAAPAAETRACAGSGTALPRLRPNLRRRPLRPSHLRPRRRRPLPAAPPPPAPAPAVARPATAPPAGNGTVTSPLVRRHARRAGSRPGADPRDGRRWPHHAARRRRGDPRPYAVRAERNRDSTRGGARGAAGTRGPAPAPVPRGTGDDVVPFDNIRRRTAEHMVRSKATSAHVYTSVKVDFERVERVRRANQAEWKAEEGFSLTYLPFIVRAFCDVVHDYPHVNASVDGDSLVVHRDLHLGIAVDLDFKGLVAPVIRNADGKRMRLIAREIRDLAARAKSKQLGPDEVVGGTFTITNMGPFGTSFTLPIINQPQVAILATDAIRKEPVVVEGPDGDDTIAIHHTGMLALAWDHRAFDGAYAASFLNEVRRVLETHDWEAELA